MVGFDNFSDNGFIIENDDTNAETWDIPDEAIDSDGLRELFLVTMENSMDKYAYS